MQFFDKLNTLGGSFLMLNNEYIHILQPVTAVLTKSAWELSDKDCYNQNIPLLSNFGLQPHIQIPKKSLAGSAVQLLGKLLSN